MWRHEVLASKNRRAAQPADMLTCRAPVLSPGGCPGGEPRSYDRFASAFLTYPAMTSFAASAQQHDVQVHAAHAGNVQSQFKHRRLSNGSDTPCMLSFAVGQRSTS